MGGTASAFLQAEPEAVWQTLLDFPGHARLFPRVKESAVVEHQDNRTLVSYRVAVGLFSFRFFIKNYIDPLPTRFGGSWIRAGRTTYSGTTGAIGKSIRGARGRS